LYTFVYNCYAVAGVNILKERLWTLWFPERWDFIGYQTFIFSGITLFHKINN